MGYRVILVTPSDGYRQGAEIMQLEKIVRNR